MKKAQITVFMILGVLMIMLLFLFTYLIGLKAESSTNVNIEKTIETALRNKAISTYVATCLEEATKQGLLLMGLQGSNIYDDQVPGGRPRLLTPYARSYVPLFSPVEANYYDVRYNIKDITWPLVNPDFPEQGPFPYPGNLESSPNVNKMDKLGRSQLPILCYKNGSNQMHTTRFDFSCETYATDPRATTQYLLEKYIAYNTKACINFSYFQTIGQNITDGGEPNASVLFGEDHVFVSLLYPISISIRGEEPIIRLADYSTELPVRFKKIYELAKHIIEEDINNVFFRFNVTDIQDRLQNCRGIKDKEHEEGVTRTLQNMSCLYPGMEVSYLEDPCLKIPGLCTINEFSDLIVITDNHSIIEDDPYLFIFGVENRAPALDYIDESVPPDKYYYNYLLSEYSGLTPLALYQKTSLPVSFTQKNTYHIILDIGERILIIPLAIDPDGEEVTYSYSGWRTPIQITAPDGTVHGGDSASNRWEESETYKFSYLTYTEKNKDANYPSDSSEVLSSFDTGSHWVRVNVTDASGRSDWQDIHIQVRCIPGPCCTSDYEVIPDGDGGLCGECQRCYAGQCMNVATNSDCSYCYGCQDGSCSIKDATDPRCIGLGNYCMDIAPPLGVGWSCYPPPTV